MRYHLLKHKPFFVVLVLVPLYFACRDDSTVPIPPKAVKGILDVTTWDFNKNGPVDLKGEFEFYWHQHLDPSDFTKLPGPQKTGFIKVPGYWNDYALEGEKLGGPGYATYRLAIFPGIQRDPLALRFVEVSTAYSLFINGKKMSAVGIAGKNRETTVPRYFPQIVDFDVETNRLEIILQVSNFHHRRGGLWEVIQLGREKDIRDMQQRRLNFDLFLLGSILIMALYHLGLFFFRKKNRSPLYFSLFCILISLRLLTTGERYLIHLFPAMSWEVVIQLEYLSFYLAVPAFALFMRSIFQDFSNRFFIAVGGVSGAFSGVVMVTPPRIFSLTLNAYEAITLIVFIYGLYVIIRTLARRRAEALVFLLGFIILSLAAINDMLHVERVIQTGFYAPLGLFVFILSHASLLSFRFSNALTTVEQQGRELKQTFEAYKTEIIDRLKAQDALRFSEEKYRTILHSIEDGYYEVDLTGNLTFFNDALCRILGYPQDELMGMNNRQFMSTQTAQRVYETFNQVYRSGQASKVLDWEMVRKDGSTKFIETSISLMRDPHGQPIGFRGVARDITERKQAEEQTKLHQQQLMQASKMVALGTLVSGVAHEINNPNNFIMLNTPILKEAWENALPLLEKYYAENGDFILGGMNYTQLRISLPTLFDGIAEGTKRIKQIVDDLKHYVKDEAADHSQAVDINAVIKSATSLLANMIRKSTDHFITQYGTDLPLLRGNSQRLEQVLINLLQNACQALPDAAKGIFISTAFDAQRSRIVIIVRDKGTGIPPESIPHITDPFFTTKQDLGGVGLGLSISALIVKEHGGTMDFASEAGSGTTVTISLPVDHKNNSSKGIS